MTIGPAGTLTCENNRDLYIRGNLFNNGTINTNDNVYFYGNSFINNGVVTNCAFVMGQNGYNQYLSGSGVFSKTRLFINGGTVFLSDINCINGTYVSAAGGL
ncbi:MAG: hypothetical protein IPG99_06265 [Ignavibacteria bacterium]|nr:hypothetical protein [Ignavibacteria bacterium]